MSKTSPNYLAYDFFMLEPSEKVVFFNILAKLVEGGEGMFLYNVDCILESKELTDEARQVLKWIGK